MATIEDAAALALGLPEVSEVRRFSYRTWAVGGKGFAWERPFSKADMKRFGAEVPPDGPILAVRVEDLGEKEAVLGAGLRGFFTIVHFDNYPAVLIQLKVVGKRAFREAILDGWLACAPPNLAEEYLAALEGSETSASVVSDAAWRRYAVVLVDLQQDFWPADVASTAPELPARVADLLEYARTHDLTVVHVRARFDADGGNWMARYRLLGRIPCIDGTTGAETLPFAREVAGKPVVTKHSFDGFLETEGDAPGRVNSRSSHASTGGAPRGR